MRNPPPGTVTRFVEELVECGVQLARMLDHMYLHESPDPDIPPPPDVLRDLVAKTIEPDVSTAQARPLHGDRPPPGDQPHDRARAVLSSIQAPSTTSSQATSRTTASADLNGEMPDDPFTGEPPLLSPDRIALPA